MQTQLLGRTSLTAVALAMSVASAQAAEARPPVQQGQATTLDKGKPKSKAEAEREARAAAGRAALEAKKGNANAPGGDTAGGEGTEIVVRGIRDSLAEARQEKRNAEQIVDVINAEEVGKLPANTIGDVLSYIPGIQVGRNEGEVEDIQLRGLSGVQTTINGAESFSGIGRTTNLQDLPADLVKSIQVYKTTTPSQIEGSGYGSINIELRRPTDFRKGFSTFVNATGRYNSQAKQYFQNYTGIVNYRADTPLGPMGLLLNFTYNSNPFLESRAANGNLTTLQPRQVTGPQILPYPILGPSQVWYQYNVGTRLTKSYAASAQWKPTDQLGIVLEGTFNQIRFRGGYNQLFLDVLANTANSHPALSNVTLVPGTNRLASATVSPVTQLGPISYSQNVFTDQFNGRFAVDYDSDFLSLSSKFNVNISDAPGSQQNIRNRFVNRPVYDIEFASDKFKYKQVDVVFRNLDLLDPSQYRFTQFDDATFLNKGALYESRVDLTLRPRTAFIDTIQFGIRAAHRTWTRENRSRAISGLLIPVDQMPGGFSKLIPIAKGFEGTGVENNARWLSYDREAARSSFPELYALLAKIEAERGVASPVFGTTDGPLRLDDQYRGTEDVLAVYGQANYRFNLLFPIDGFFGARIVNTMINTNSVGRRTGRRIVNGVNQTVTEVEPASSRTNGLDVNPSAAMNIHFTSALQLRLAYTRAITRPSTNLLNPYISLTEGNADPTYGGSIVAAGNPNLKPQEVTKYDASLEYYFGKTGIITVAPFYWKLNGLIGSFVHLETVPGSSTPYLVQRPINAGLGYRRGVEVQAQTFFTFLPGIMKNFGISGNFTYVDSRLHYIQREDATLPEGDVPIAGTAPMSGTIMGMFERGGLSGRLSWNWRDKFVTEVRAPVRNSIYILPFSWVEANVNYRFTQGALKNLSIGFQAQNLLASARRTFYGYPDQPREVVYMARTYGLTARYNF